MSAPVVVRAAARGAHWSSDSRLSLLAVGKAAAPMARALVASVSVPVSGLVIGTHLDGELPGGLRWEAAAHPVPDERSLRAAERALAFCRSRQAPDRLVVLVSGGASALLCLPAPGIALADKQAVTRGLLAGGAPIEALNAVRKHLSQVKGGRLAAACAAPIDAWLLSDVVGDDPSVIGSGPTTPDPSSYGDALRFVERYLGRPHCPPAVLRHLEAGVRGDVPETPKPGSLPHVTTQVIGSAALAVRAAADAARARGHAVIVRPDPIVGEAREAARGHVEWTARAVAGAAGPVCVLSHGETTVHVTGGGRGGRNQEFALACALELERRDLDWRVASLGTDGVDGPTDAAGAIVDRGTAARARRLGIEPEACLAANDSHAFFARAGGHIRTGPTDTNVGDVQIVLAPGAQAPPAGDARRR